MCDISFSVVNFEGISVYLHSKYGSYLISLNMVFNHVDDHLTELSDGSTDGSTSELVPRFPLNIFISG